MEKVLQREWSNLQQCLYIYNLQYMVISEKLIGVHGQANYLFMLSYVFERKEIIITFLWPAEILVTCKKSYNPCLQALFVKHAIYRYIVNSKLFKYEPI